MLAVLESLVFAALASAAIAIILIFTDRHDGKLRSMGLSAFIRRRSDPAVPKSLKTAPRAMDGIDEKVVQVEEEDEDEEVAKHKQMYYKLHNIEKSLEVLPGARNQLVDLFAEALVSARTERPLDSILTLDTYTLEGLDAFMKQHDLKVNEAWAEYSKRRDQGGPRELVKDVDEAKWWLKQIAPVKYVDGAWLGYINRSTLPFHLRSAVKHSWQVLSEELGDGDLGKNHAYLFRELIKDVAPDLPDGDSEEFIHPKQGLNAPLVWKAALAQMLISLFPHEFFPEILGFNMHFEALALETLMASRELQELKINAYYFLLHVSIDNADSGHTAIAQAAVVEYLEQVKRREGAAAAHQAWRRVQVGYTLSDRMPGSAVPPSKRKPATKSFPRNELESEVIKIFISKAEVAHKTHTHSTVKLGGKRLVDWLDPEYLASEENQMGLMDSLANNRAWVSKGNGKKSRFVKELLWGGRMFGAFTEHETNTVISWIDAMAEPSPAFYYDFTGRADRADDVTSETDSQVKLDTKRPLNTQRFKAADPSDSFTGSTPTPPAASLGIHFNRDTKMVPERFLPLWFAHPAILESFVAIPFKTTTPFASAIVRILRAHAGFEMESSIVAGIDEANRADESVGLIEIGQEMMRRLELPAVDSMKEVLEKWDDEYAVTMLNLAMRPWTNKGLLIGMAQAFANLHNEMTASTLCACASKDVLRVISRREHENLGQCVKDLSDVEYKDYCRGYWSAAEQLKNCFVASE